jgi:hypothetical protein
MFCVRVHPAPVHVMTTVALTPAPTASHCGHFDETWTMSPYGAIA